MELSYVLLLIPTASGATAAQAEEEEVLADQEAMHASIVASPVTSRESALSQGRKEEISVCLEVLVVADLMEINREGLKAEAAVDITRMLIKMLAVAAGKLLVEIHLSSILLHGEAISSNLTL